VSGRVRCLMAGCSVEGETDSMWQHGAPTLRVWVGGAGGWWRWVVACPPPHHRATAATETKQAKQSGGGRLEDRSSQAAQLLRVRRVCAANAQCYKFKKA